MLILKRMGVMNITPNSFSDGGELSPANFSLRLQQLGPIDILDVGAESTAPMNAAISAEEEWGRIEPYLPQLQALKVPLGLDTYHPETVFRFLKACPRPLIWNDVSGKWDSHVERYLALGDHLQYVYCHNLAPTRDQTIKHMETVSSKEKGEFLHELAEFFRPHLHPRVILDPCLGFSKTYEQNWYILDHFSDLQKFLPNQRWLIGFSRKSFLRKKYNLTLEQRDQLDQIHLEEVNKLKPKLSGEVWLRTHRPEIL